MADATSLRRFYFDASHWNRLFDHPRRDSIVAECSRRAWAVFPSVYNAAELLNTDCSERRVHLCGLMLSMLDPHHSVLDHPKDLLRSVTEQIRQGASAFEASEGPAARQLRLWLEHPATMDEDSRAELRAWTDATKMDLKNWRAASNCSLPGEAIDNWR